MPQNKYPLHSEVRRQTMDIVHNNFSAGQGREHSRETLDDIISDLTRFRDSLPTVQDYLDANEL